MDRSLSLTVPDHGGSTSPAQSSSGGNDRSAKDRSRWRSFLSPKPSVVERLLSYQKRSGEDREEKSWGKNTISVLVKKIKATGDLAELEKAIACGGSAATMCVIVYQTEEDTRLQVRQRKDPLHVTCCRLWRWPTLRSRFELKPIPTCKHAFSLSRSGVCVNPYHYIRIEAPGEASLSPSTRLSIHTATTVLSVWWEGVGERYGLRNTGRECLIGWKGGNKCGYYAVLVMCIVSLPPPPAFPPSLFPFLSISVISPVLVPTDVPVPSLPPPLFNDVLPENHTISSWPSPDESLPDLFPGELS